MTDYPLTGVTVIDLGQIYQGPYATFLMAMAGARVIKVEPRQGEPARRRARVGGGGSVPMAMLNSNKDCITLNLKTETGRELLRRLVRKADVLLENYAPTVMDRLGVAATARASFGVYNTREDADVLVQALETVQEIFG